MLAAVMMGCADPVEEPVDPASLLPREPARKALRRLNRSEYDRTVRDLLGTQATPAQDFPSDDSSHGFDNAADALSLSPLWLESVESAASRLAREVVREPLDAPIDEVWAYDDGGWVSDNPCNSDFVDSFALWCTGALQRSFSLPVEGTWRFTARVAQMPAGDESAVLSFVVDDLHDRAEPVDVIYGQGWQEIVFDIALSAGDHTLALGFANDAVVGDDDRNLIFQQVDLHGPTPFVRVEDGPWARVMVCTPEGPQARDCARRILEGFVPRAWRRPVDASEIDRLLTLYDVIVAEGDPPLWGVEFVVRAVLTSPNFLFLHETPDAPLADHDLAERISYLLWSSMPDETLTELAASGELHDPAVLRQQVERMTRDPRSEALVDDFAGQWLFVRAVDDAFPDVWYFPEFTPALRESMKGQMSTFFRSFVGKDRSLKELLTSEIGYIDEALGVFYGVDREPRSGFRSFNLGVVDRYGWLGQAGLQMALSYPTRTSPVRRGVWVLGNLLCEEPKPPPPGVEGIEDIPDDATTLRGQFEQHRANPGCAICHDDIDPIGFAFEHYDGIGHFRELDDGIPIDASGELPGGKTFTGLTELSTILAEDERYSHCIVEKGFTYAMGRPPADTEEGILHDIHSDFVRDGMTLDALWTAIITSDTFRTGGTP